ncbi:MAG: hypothetical protein JNK02_09755 [Planctomycetes bacterium]|nr:hypothetical protein [Planctomycetota bacterium]
MCAAALASAVLAACQREVRRAGSADAPRAEGARSRLDGADQGQWTWRYPDGTLRERGALQDGLRVGTWTQWWSNGAVRAQGARVPDRATRSSPREGPWTFWHPNGQFAARGIYQAGQREGWWEFSLDDGRLDGDQSGLYHEDARILDG